jgi:hypothetical protein
MIDRIHVERPDLNHRTDSGFPIHNSVSDTEHIPSKVLNGFVLLLYLVYQIEFCDVSGNFAGMIFVQNNAWAHGAVSIDLIGPCDTSNNSSNHNRKSF